MQSSLLQLFKEYPHLAVVLSIFVSIVIAVIGFLPSVFITAANILFFGFWQGTLISFLGEAVGAGIAFILYRKGFRKTVAGGLQKYPRVKKLVDATGKEAFYLVFSLRLIPFVPSGLITFAAAMGKMPWGSFFLASSLGKLPALLMEAWSVYEVTRFGLVGKLLLAIVAVVVIYQLIRSKK